MVLRLRAMVDRWRSSLFLVPTISVIVGGALGVGMVEVDKRLDDTSQLPFVLTSTVDSAREVLSVVASATITFAGIAFSVSLLVIQQASSQYSPRVVHSLFRDPFNRRVMGLVVGVFTYALMVLRAVRNSLTDGGNPVIPNVSITLAVVLGVAAILGIIAFIDHSAHTMEVSAILNRVNEDTIEQLREGWTLVDPDDDATEEALPSLPDGEGHTVLIDRSGWLQQMDVGRLLRLVPAGGAVRLDTAVGRFAVRGTPLCTIWPPPDDPEDTEERAADAIEVGRVRSIYQDPSYGIRQLADVALVALSPGVNDPTTAQDAIFHLVEVLRAALVRRPPAAVVRDDDGRCLIRAQDETDDSIVELAFDEIRQASCAMPTVSVYLLEALHLLDEALRRRDLAGRTPAIRRQAELLVAGADRSDMLPEDLARVRAAFAERFAPTASTS